MRIVGLISAALLLMVTGAVADGDPVEFGIATIEGGRFELADHRDQWVAVNFWATWCKPCRKEIPDLDSLHRGRDDVVVLGLAFEEVEPEAIVTFLEDYDTQYPIALVDVYEPPADFGVPRVLPTTVMVDPDGRIAKTFVGPVTSAEILEYIDASTAE